MNDDRAVELTGDLGEVVFIEENAVAELLYANILFVTCNNVDDDDGIAGIAVLCNDLFWWGTADCSQIPYLQIETLWRIWKSDAPHGIGKWCCLQRGMRPQWPVAKLMIAAGVWDAAMDALPLRTTSDEYSVHGWSQPEAREFLAKRAERAG